MLHMLQAAPIGQKPANGIVLGGGSSHEAPLPPPPAQSHFSEWCAGAGQAGETA